MPSFSFLSGVPGFCSGLVLISSVIARKEKEKKKKAKFLNKLIRGATTSLTCQMSVLFIFFLISLLLLHLLLLFLPLRSYPFSLLLFFSSSLSSSLPLHFLFFPLLSLFPSSFLRQGFLCPRIGNYSHTHYVAKAKDELKPTLLSLSPELWGYKHVPPCLACVVLRMETSVSCLLAI